MCCCVSRTNCKRNAAESPEAFGEDYSFLSQSNTTSLELIEVNVSSTILILKRLLPRLLASSKPRRILTDSISALPGNGRPEVAIGTSKTALTGIASALREGLREHRLGVTLLQLETSTLKTPCLCPLTELLREETASSSPCMTFWRWSGRC